MRVHYLIRAYDMHTLEAYIQDTCTTSIRESIVTGEHTTIDCIRAQANSNQAKTCVTTTPAHIGADGVAVGSGKLPLPPRPRPANRSPARARTKKALEFINHVALRKRQRHQATGAVNLGIVDENTRASVCIWHIWPPARSRCHRTRCLCNG